MTTVDCIVHLKRSSIYPNPDQPRKFFDAAELSNLARSIQQHGQLDPLLVTTRPCAGRGTYMIVAGERRWRAAGLIPGFSQMKCIVREFDARTLAEIALFENIQRENLHPLEEGRAFLRLLVDHGQDASSAAQHAGKSRAYVRARLALCDLVRSVDELPQTRHLSLAQLAPVAKLKGFLLQATAIGHIFSEGLTAAAASRYCEKLKGEPPSLLGLVGSFTPPHSVEPLKLTQTWAMQGGEVHHLLSHDPMSVPTNLIDVLVVITRKVLRAAEAIQSHRGEPK